MSCVAIATVNPKRICLLGLTGDVIGSGSITMAKKIVVGSSNLVRKDVREKVNVPRCEKIV